MASEYVMAIDAGGGGGHALIVGLGSGALTRAFRPWRHPGAPGTGGLGTDLDLAAIWDAVGTAAREARERAGIRPEQIGGVAVTSMRHTTIALDGNGTATAVFGGSGAMAKRNTRPADGPWGTAQLLDQGYYVEIYYPTVAANARGFALIGYLGWKDPGAMDPTQGIPVVHAAMRQPAASCV